MIRYIASVAAERKTNLEH